MTVLGHHADKVLIVVFTRAGQHVRDSALSDLASGHSHAVRADRAGQSTHERAEMHR